MENYKFIYKNDKEWLGFIKDVYTVEFFESANDNTYELEIYDDTGVYHDPKEFMECTTKGFRAVNLTEDDVQAFFDTLNGVYTVYIRERTNGTYELSISEKGIYINPKIFMDCKTKGLTAVNMTFDDVNAFCDAVRDSDLTNKKQYCLFNI